MIKLKVFNNTVINMTYAVFCTVFLWSASRDVFELPMEASLTAKTALVANFKSCFFRFEKEIFCFVSADIG